MHLDMQIIYLFIFYCEHQFLQLENKTVDIFQIIFESVTSQPLGITLGGLGKNQIDI